MPENKRLRYDKPRATVCEGAASGPLRPLPKVSKLVKMFNKKAIFDNKKGGKRRDVQKERGFGPTLWVGSCHVSDPEAVQSRLSHHVGVLVLQLVQLFALLPQKQDSADGRTSERVKKKGRK